MADYDSDDKSGIPLLEELSDHVSVEGHSHISKRKRTADREIEDQTNTEARKKKRKKRTKGKTSEVDEADEDALDGTLGVNRAIGCMDNRLIADHLAQRIKRFLPDLSPIEAEELGISENWITDTTTFPRVRSTENLPSFIDQFAEPVRTSGKKEKSLQDAPRDKGSPHTFVLAGAGLRAADITRVLRRYQKADCKVAKLFAKHIKMKEAIEMSKQTRMNFGVGTPQRISDLVAHGCLSTTHLERIIVDASHIDQKKRGILDMGDTAKALARLLTRPELRQRYGAGEGQVKLLFY